MVSRERAVALLRKTKRNMGSIIAMKKKKTLGHVMEYQEFRKKSEALVCKGMSLLMVLLNSLDDGLRKPADIQAALNTR